ncbi:MAG: zinc ribbon domain-containing protein [Ruminococcus sp.]|nr:zinc ribbon domain-containing protein [Ruminococcus sp.]
MFEASSPYTRDQLITRNRQYIKEFLRHPFTLITALSFAVSELLSLILSVVFFVFTSAIPTDKLTQYMQEFTGSDSVEFSTSLDLTPSVATILLVIIFLLLYFKSKSTDPKTSPVMATTMLKVYTTVNLILQVMGALLLLLIPVIIGGVLIAIQSGYNSYIPPLPDRVVAVSIITVSAYILFNIAINIVNAVSFRRFSVSLQESLTTENLTHKGATAYAATCFIRIGESIASSLLVALFFFRIQEMLGELAGSEIYDLLKDFRFSTIGILMFALGVAASLHTVFLALFALRFRKHIIDAGENGCNLAVTDVPALYTAEGAPIGDARLSEENPYIFGNPFDFDDAQTPQEADNTSDDETPTADESPNEQHAPVATVTPAEPEQDPDSENPYADFAKPVEVHESAQESTDNKSTSLSTAPNFCCMCGTPVRPEQKFCAHCGNKLI